MLYLLVKIKMVEMQMLVLKCFLLPTFEYCQDLSRFSPHDGFPYPSETVSLQVESYPSFVSLQVESYPFSSFLAEFGGALSLFTGFSFMMLQEGLHTLVQRLWASAK